MENYKVLRAIGKGSFGKVYVVRHIGENKHYVMKVIKMRGIPKAERESCKNEVEIMQRLPHPNIVAYKDSFSVQRGAKLCIVMTYCDGGDLSARIEQQRSTLLPEDQILHWFVQLALGLGCMHAHKILHRDLKTANMFLLSSGRLVLGDLGISKTLDATMAMASTQIGTPYYMSPELFQSKPYNHKSDVWAIGCVLYEMCALKHPFEADSIGQLSARIARGKYAPIATRYSKGLRSLIASLLTQAPSARPDVDEVLRSPFMRKPLMAFVKDMADRAKSGAAVLGGGTMALGSALKELAADGGSAGGLGPHSASLFNQIRGLGLGALAQQDAEMQSWKRGAETRAQSHKHEAEAASRARHAPDAGRRRGGPSGPSGSGSGSGSGRASARERVLERKARERRDREEAERGRLEEARVRGAEERRAVSVSRRDHFSGAGAAVSIAGRVPSGGGMGLPGARYGDRPPRAAPRGRSDGGSSSVAAPAPASRSASVPDEPVRHTPGMRGAGADDGGAPDAAEDDAEDDADVVRELGMDPDLEAAAEEDERELAEAAAELKAAFEASVRRCDKLQRSIQRLRRRADDDEGDAAAGGASADTPPRRAAPPAEAAAPAAEPRMSPGTEALLLRPVAAAGSAGDGYGYEYDGDEAGEEWGDDWAAEWGDADEEAMAAAEAGDAEDEEDEEDGGGAGGDAESGYLGRRAAAVRAEVASAVGPETLDAMLQLERRRLEDPGADADPEVAAQLRAVMERLGPARQGLLQRVRELVHVESVLGVA